MMHDKNLILYQIFFIFVLPVAVLWIGIVPMSWRMIVLCVSILFMYGVIQHERITDTDMGIVKKTPKTHFFVYTIFTLAGIFFLAKLSDLLAIRPETKWWESSHLLFLFLPVSLLQEVAYRGFLFLKLRKLFSSKTLIIGVNILLFTLLHVIYPMPGVMLPVALISGVGFSVLYWYFPNLILISLSHAILNFLAVFYGFFNFPR